MIGFGDWYCPNCGIQAQLPVPKPSQSHMHTCPRLRGLSAPLIPAGVLAKVTAHDREDYVGDELVQTDPQGRPIMSVVTEFANGRRDTAVYAPLARANIREV